jgi:26S proteasome subunit RPN7
MTMVDDKKTTATKASKKDGGAKKKKPNAASEETAAPYPNMQLGQEIHRLTVAFSESNRAAPRLPDGSDALPLVTKVFGQIATELENPSLYRHLQQTLFGNASPDAISIAAAKLTVDDLIAMQTRHDAKLQELEAAVEEAKESAGDMEVLEARIAVARFAAKSLSCDQALSSYEAVISWTKISSGKKMDALMECARLASFHGKATTADEYIQKAEKVAESSGGGDWDRRNR